MGLFGITGNPKELHKLWIINMLAVTGSALQMDVDAKMWRILKTWFYT
jgi:hypothetical protein